MPNDEIAHTWGFLNKTTVTACSVTFLHIEAHAATIMYFLIIPEFE